ncbi:Uridine permease [Nakaseomyces bracarensis]|uniref:Uridine permease n=1 Tax=Nakaseomyces bracarensis TaxID=273131 RepID=A0ABR4NYQ6_9SACH
MHNITSSSEEHNFSMTSDEIVKHRSEGSEEEKDYKIETVNITDTNDVDDSSESEDDDDKYKKAGKWRYYLFRIVDFLEVKQSNSEGEITESKSVLETFIYNDDLAPVDKARRVWTWKEYIFFWISGAFNVNTWQISATGLQLGLNWWQTWICIWVGYTFVALFLIAGSRVGNMYHISFPIASRIAFGTYFSIWIVLNRVVMACVWFSTLAYLGGDCVQLMLLSIFGNNLNTKIHDTIPNPNLTNFQFMCFMLFWVVSLPFLWFPPHKLRYIFAIKSAITPFAAFGFLIWTLKKAHGHLALGNLNGGGKISSSVLAWSVIRSIMSALDNFSTLILNAPDFSRFAKTPKSSIYSQLFILPVCYAVISLIGILSASAAYRIYGVNYWNPLDILNRYLEHYTSGNRAGVFLISFAFAFDQLGSNLSGNAIPAGTDMTALLPKFINIRRGAYICACIALVICPWNLMASSSKFTTALGAYAVFLSAIAGVISADYFIVRKGYVNVFDCYSNKPGSFYMYNKYGTNWRAVAGYIVGIAPNFAGFLGSIDVHVPVGAMKVYYLNYFIGYLVAALVYLVLVYYFPVKGVPDNAKLFDRVWHEEWIEVEDFRAQREAYEKYGDISMADAKLSA